MTGTGSDLLSKTETVGITHTSGDGYVVKVDTVKKGNLKEAKDYQDGDEEETAR